MYRVLWCALILTVGDISVAIAYDAINNELLPAPIVHIIYLFLDVISLVCSYKDYGKRLFPFKSVSKNLLDESSSQPTETKKNEIKNVDNSKRRTLLLKDSEAISTVEYSIETSNKS